MDKKTLSHIKHELRNPIAGSKLLLEMLINGVAGELNENQKSMLLDIEKSNEKMLSIINELDDADKAS